MPRKPRMFCSCLARLARMAHTFGSLARTLATLVYISNSLFQARDSCAKVFKKLEANKVPWSLFLGGLQFN